MSHRLVLVCAVTLLALGGLGLAGAQQEIVTLDENTPLSHQATIDTWTDEQPVNVSTSQLQMDLSIARDPETVGVDQLSQTGLTTLYLRVQYNETIPRTIRFYVPSEYWTPYPTRNAESIGGDVSAAFEPTANQTDTSVTIDVDGRTDAVIPVSQRAAWAFSARYQTNDVLENATGFDVPTMSASSQWEYIEPRQLESDEGRAAIESTNSDVVIQFDAHPGNATRWENARACSESDRRVCSFTVSGDQRTYVMSRSADAPRVRYKLGGGLTDRFYGSWNELTGLVEDGLGQLDEVLPW